MGRDEDKDAETGGSAQERDALAGGEFTDEMTESETDADLASGATEGAEGMGEGRLTD
jgi:hypothetical protein